MYGCESWNTKKAECQRIGAFEPWCSRWLLRVPWTARRANQSMLKEISPGCSLEGLMLKLKLQYFGHLMRRVDSFEKTLSWERLKSGEGDDRGWDGWMASLIQWPRVWGNSRSWWWTGRPDMLQSMGRKVSDRTDQLNWTELFACLVECSLPFSSLHGILQARILEWVAISFSRGSFQPRDRTRVSSIGHRFFTIWATRETSKTPKVVVILRAWFSLLSLSELFFPKSPSSLLS